MTVYLIHSGDKGYPDRKVVPKQVPKTRAGSFRWHDYDEAVFYIMYCNIDLIT